MVVRCNEHYAIFSCAFAGGKNRAVEQVSVCKGTTPTTVWPAGAAEDILNSSPQA